MIRGDMIWRIKLRRGQLALLVALSLLVCCGGSPPLAQAMRSPNLNVAPRIPHIDPNIAGRAVTGVMGDSNRIRPDCSAASRDAGGNCSGQAATSVAHTAGKGSAKDKAARGTTQSASLNLRVIANEIVAEIDGTLSDAQADALARRHGLRRIESRSFELIGATIGLFRITGGKTLEGGSREVAQ